MVNFDEACFDSRTDAYIYYFTGGDRKTPVVENGFLQELRYITLQFKRETCRYAGGSDLCGILIDVCRKVEFAHRFADDFFEFLDCCLDNFAHSRFKTDLSEWKIEMQQQFLYIFPQDPVGAFQLRFIPRRIFGRVQCKDFHFRIGEKNFLQLEKNFLHNVFFIRIIQHIAIELKIDFIPDIFQKSSFAVFCSDGVEIEILDRRYILIDLRKQVLVDLRKCLACDEAF